jgi:formylglycine-generating enzyme required for sulfatase activity/serine/threonine protein kinase
VNRPLPPELGRRIDEVCNRFEAAWRAGPPPRLEDFLADWQGPERLALLRELVLLDADYRRTAGQHFSPEHYRGCFPDLDPTWLAEALPPAAMVQTPPKRDGTHPAADRNLLCGILALQMDFISRDDLIAAMNAWVLDKGKPLGQILRAMGRLAEDEHALLEAMVRKHLQKHRDDPQQSLAAVGPAGPLRDHLRQIADADVQASVARVCPTPSHADPETTGPFIGPGTLPPHARFHILRPHARGGLGEVFVARDQELRREVALKEIQERHAGHPESRARFLLEAEVTGSLEHPGIVPVYGLGCYADGRPFYAMRFIQGDTLKDAIHAFHQADQSGRSESGRSLELRQLLGRFVDVCNAIAYAHSRGVLHRDIKPANIMLGKFGETLVVDWGLAKVMGQGGGEGGEGPLVPGRGGDAAMTQSGVALGTPAYMSPEQAVGKLDQLGPASDVYSLGATLYCLLTGQAPFAEADVGAVLARVQRGDFPRPRQVNRRVPAALEAVCLKAMGNKPQDRYATPRELAEEVEHWLGDEPVGAYREPWPTRAGRWVRRHQTPVAGVTALLLTSLIAVGISSALILREQERKLAVARQLEETALQHTTFVTYGPQVVTPKYSTMRFKRLVGAKADLYAELLLDLRQPAAAEALGPLLREELEKTAPDKPTDADMQQLAFRQANAAVTLLHLGEPEGVWPLLAHSSDPTRRTYLTQHLGPYGIPAAVVLDRLQVEKDVSARRALLLSLGEYPLDKVLTDRLVQDYPTDVAKMVVGVATVFALVDRLVQEYRTDPDPGIHAAIEWLLRQWHEDARLPKLKDYQPKATNQWQPTWYVNGQGQTLTVIPRPGEFQMGSPESEPHRTPDERPHWRKIPRSFAIAAKEVTVAEFRRFLRDNPAIEKEFAADGHLADLEKYSPADDGPRLKVDWYTAAAYCNWLSRQEGLPQAEWCYPSGKDQIRPGMVMPEGYLRRKGYRLPTEAEWEYACRTGARTNRSFGRSEALLGKYAWYDQNAEGHAHPVGRLRPNDLGLFDMLGNAAEWCQDRAGDYPNEAMQGPIVDGEDSERQDAARRVVRGGSFADRAVETRSARRDGHPPAEPSIRVGLRMARTCDGSP